MIAVCEPSRVFNHKTFGPICALFNFATAIVMFVCCAVLVYK